jgi:hypothetical protein
VSSIYMSSVLTLYGLVLYSLSEPVTAVASMCLSKYAQSVAPRATPFYQILSYKSVHVPAFLPL